MSSINGLATVNGGTIMEVLGETVEVMGVGYSSHPTSIISYYMWHEGKKVEISYWINDNQPIPKGYSREGAGIAFYKKAEDLHAYRYHSFAKRMGWIPSRYLPIIEKLKKIHQEVFKAKVVEA